MAASENKNPNGSTGPTSPDGKARSSQNSLKHGLCSQKLILLEHFASSPRFGTGKIIYLPLGQPSPTNLKEDSCRSRLGQLRPARRGEAVHLVGPERFGGKR